MSAASINRLSGMLSSLSPVKSLLKELQVQILYESTIGADGVKLAGHYCKELTNLITVQDR